jgi:pilus assembly protein CpaE
VAIDTTAPAGTLRVLVAASDPTLLDECRAAFQATRDLRAMLYAATPGREALDVARDRQPQLVVVEAEAALDLTRVARELLDVAPSAFVAAAYRQGDGADGTDGRLIVEWLRAGVQDFLRRPISPVELGVVVDRLFAGRAPAGAAAQGRVASFVSNKGGVGKSTLAVNVACTLARRHPGQVLLVDASLQLGVTAMMLGLTPTATILDAARERERLDEALLRGLTLPHESGLRVLAAPGDALEAAEVGDEAFARILHLARRTFAFVIVDTFPLLDSVVMAALDASDLVYLVLQGTAPGVTGMARLLPVLEGLGFPAGVQRVVLSRNHKRFLGDLTVSDVEARLGRPVDVVVPYERRVLVSMNTGHPVVLTASWWTRFARAAAAIANDIQGTATLGASTPSTDAAATTVAPPDRRSGVDRRQANLGFIGRDRRSGLDRRATVGSAATRGLEHEAAPASGARV